MKKASSSERVDLATWTLDSTEKLNALFLEAVSEAVDIAVEEGGDVRFACEHEPAAPDILHVYLPLGRSEDADPAWEASLKEIVETLINTHAVDGKIVEDSVRTVASVRDMLRELADRIDAALDSTL
jgi:nucleotide-binding universal stress UspA family protein